MQITQRIAKASLVKPDEGKSPFINDADRRLEVKELPHPPTQSLRWDARPDLPGGNPAWTYRINSPTRRFAVLVGHVENGSTFPFECWVMGDFPRGLNAVAKSLSRDMRSQDRTFLRRKLESLAECEGEPFVMTMPDGDVITVPSEVAAFARIVQWQCEQLGTFEDTSNTSVTDALMFKKEPKTTADGTLAWMVDVANLATGDNFKLFLAEAMVKGQRRPYSIWLSGNYPRSLDGLCKVLSIDLQVVEIEWGLRKLMQLLDCEESMGGFMAQVPGSEKRTWYPSSVAYIATLIRHRFQLLGLANGNDPTVKTDVIRLSQVREPRREKALGPACPACGSHNTSMGGGCLTCLSCSHSKCS